MQILHEQLVEQLNNFSTQKEQIKIELHAIYSIKISEFEKRIRELEAMLEGLGSENK